jgi:hypothetical protein
VKYDLNTIEEDDLHVAHGAKGHAQASLHASRVHARKVVRPLVQLHLVEDLVHRLQ